MNEKTILEQRIDDGLGKLTDRHEFMLNLYRERYLNAKAAHDKDEMWVHGNAIHAYLTALKDCDILTTDNVDYIYFHYTR